MNGEGGMDEQTDERTNERKSPCVLQDFVPFGAAAQQVKDDGKRYRETKTTVEKRRMKSGRIGEGGGTQGKQAKRGSGGAVGGTEKELMK